MPYAHSNTAEIYYETRGASEGAPIILIEGFGVQMIGWCEAFLQKLVDRNFHVAIFDNRDVGLSQKFGGPNEWDGGYSLDDMAEDTFGVMDALQWKLAHVVGQSMGGVIAQLMAVRRPERVRSLSLFYTAPGLAPYIRSRERPAAELELYAHRPRAEAIEAFVQRERISQSPAYAFDEGWIREWAERSFDRCYAPEGVARQAAAIRRLPDHISGLERLLHPSLIIHGRDDGHIEPAAAIELGCLLRNSEVHIYPGMGHELVEPLWEEWAGMIHRTAARAESN